MAIDNNAAERALRPIGIGRKNWLFAGADTGAETLARAMTIIETAKMNGLDPQAYPADILDRIHDHKINRLDELLPWNWSPAPSGRGCLMATITHVRTIKYVAEILDEDPELLQAIIANDDNLTYGNIVSVYNGEDESITALTDDGMEELEQMLLRSPFTSEWNDFLDCFVDDEELIARTKQSPR